MPVITNLEPNTEAWIRAWQALADLPLNARIEPSQRASAEHHGEVWQYMGTDQRGHCFRHRYHPITCIREYVFIPEEK